MPISETQQSTGQSGNWLNEETYRRILREVEAWPDWKKAAYESMGASTVRWDGAPVAR